MKEKSYEQTLYDVVHNSDFITKEEAKQKLHNLAFAKLDTKPDDLKIADVMRIVNQIYEPQKPVVPQFVADWIDVCKENLAIGLYTAMNPDFLKQWNKSDELISWIKKASNQNLFARAWLDGYTVEEEKRYLVKIKGAEENTSILNYDTIRKIWFMNDETHLNSIKTHHTRKELEDAGFGWVFDCEGVEIEEVEE